MKIYLVEDDPNIRNVVVYTLQVSGFEATAFEEAAPLYAALKQQVPDLLLLDIMLPREDGLTILRKVRETPATKNLPVIMVTAKNSEFDKVFGLDGGADDYITKPFGMLELVSRVKAVLRRTAPEKGKTAELQMGGVTLLPQQREVLVEEQKILLTMKEFDLLHLLMKNPGTVFNRDALMDQIWGYSYVGDTRTVDVHIRSLRQKLGTAGELIETVRGVGYKVVKKV